MLDGAIIIPLQGMLWGLLFEVAALIWLVDRALLLLAYFTMAVTAWITVFQRINFVYRTTTSPGE
jgi:hypothetical protein